MQEFAKVEEFAHRSALCRVFNGEQVAVFKVGEEFYAIGNICTHQGGSLSDGQLIGETVACPLHGSQFDVKTGKVLGPPATRPVKHYDLQVVNGIVSVDLASGKLLEDSVNVASVNASTASTPAIAATVMATPAAKYAGDNFGKQFRLPVVAFAVLFWLLQFLYQYFVFSAGSVGSSLVRSFALTGASLIGMALFTSSIFMWRPLLAKYWRIRRYLGVSGAAMVTFHFLSVDTFLFNFNFGKLYYSFNPIENPVIFGSIALTIFLIMASISTDWAVNKLSYPVWKNIHRLVYIAYPSAILHFLFINPYLLINPFGYLLLLITTLAAGGEVYWFLRTIAKKSFKTKATAIGFTIIGIFLLLAYLGFRKYY